MSVFAEQVYEAYVLEGWGAAIRVDASYNSVHLSIRIFDSKGIYLGYGTAKCASSFQENDTFQLPDSVPFDISDVWMVSKVYLMNLPENQGKGYGQIIYKALARIGRKVNPASVLCPSDILRRNHPDYILGEYGTSLEALKCWKRMGRDWI